MSFRIYIILFLAGLVLAFGIASFQPAPGYIDADYYFAGGLRLVQGHGFSEIFIWNYLDHPASLPHPSHSYWFPLASIIAAAGMWLTGQWTYAAARLGFILLAAMVSPLTVALAFRLTQRRETALWAGLLALFPTFIAPSMPVTDNKPVYIVLGGLFFLVLTSQKRIAPLLLGLITGLMNLARSDGLFWAVGGGLMLVAMAYQSHQQKKISRDMFWHLGFVLTAFACGYLFVMGPWMWRNFLIWGTPLSPASRFAPWLTTYLDTFAYPPDRLTFQNWLASGWMSILDARLSAMQTNLVSAIAIQAGFFISPFLLIGVWKSRQNSIVRFALSMWLALFAIITFIFPFASIQGTFANVSLPLYPMWWSLIPVGVDEAVIYFRRRGWLKAPAFSFARFSVVSINAIFTIFLLYHQLIASSWDQETAVYQQIDMHLTEYAHTTGDVVMVPNPPAYYLLTGQPSIIVPNENPDRIFQLAEKFQAHYLVLEKQYLRPNFAELFENPHMDPRFQYMGGDDQLKYFQIILQP